MEIQNLRLQALHIANGDIEKAQDIENYVLGNQKAESTGLNQQMGEEIKAESADGDCNTGDCNTGNRNTGDCNTGDCNTGNRNTGNWNTANFSNGFFNTEEVEIVNVFDKPCMKSVWGEANKPSCLYFPLTEWIFESEMSDVEKHENPSFSCTGGYLKKYDYKEAFTKSVTEASKEDRDLIRALPNFNNEKFLEISGVDLSQLD